ncbi:J domain-containing protein [Amycolatopsis sp. NPDC059657]|uniref:J domain-containing protein n=1 Tax=Amycolatopsis sp. NPDC059657 TaxID=3346899 RepID=UPI00366B7870
MTTPPDPYRVLGVSRDATPCQITTAYRTLIRALHPDTRHDPADSARLADVITAYALLRDPRRRAAYDREHPATSPARTVTRSHRPNPRRRNDIWAGPVHRHQ